MAAEERKVASQLGAQDITRGRWRMQNGEGAYPMRLFTKARRRYLGRVINGRLEELKAFQAHMPPRSFKLDLRKASENERHSQASRPQVDFQRSVHNAVK